MTTRPQHTILIVGGVGFVGHHLVSSFLDDSRFAKVVVLSRSVDSSRFRIRGATYVVGDITDLSSVKRVITDFKPTAIIHTASPSPVTGTAKEYQKVNILGTRNLLRCAKDNKHVRVLIYTSSSTLARGPVHNDLDETCPLANTDPKASAYARSKADAEIMVLHANYLKSMSDESDRINWTGYLATASLRFPIIYGTGDHTSIPGCLNALAKGQTTTILGDGSNMWSFCSAENAARAHLLLASALLDYPSETPPDKRIDGEAFNINDGAPYPFWGFAKLCWKFAGYDPKPFPKITHLPSWFVLGLAFVLEWVYWIFTFGMKRPYNLGRQQVEYACFTHTYNIEKARKRLGYEPLVDFENKLKNAVEWCLNEGGWSARLDPVKGVKSA